MSNDKTPRIVVKARKARNDFILYRVAPFLLAMILVPMGMGPLLQSGIVPPAMEPYAPLALGFFLLASMLLFVLSALRTVWSERVLNEWNTMQARRVLRTELDGEDTAGTPSDRIVAQIRKRLGDDDPTRATVEDVAARLQDLEAELVGAHTALASLPESSGGYAAVKQAVDAHESHVARLTDELATLYAALLSGGSPQAAGVADAVARLQAETEVRRLPREPVVAEDSPRGPAATAQAENG